VNIRPSTNLRTRLTLWYVAVLAVLLLLYATLVFVFQYVVLTRQIFHDEVQDVVTVEGLLYYDAQGTLQLHQDYYSRPQSHLLVDRLMEVRDLSGNILYRSPTLNGMSLGGAIKPGEGDTGFDQRTIRLQNGEYIFLISHVHSMHGQTLIIRLGYSLEPLRDRMLQFLLLLLIAVPIALIIAGLAGQALARRALRPLGQMTARAESITASNLHSRLDVENPDDELGQMARVFNHLLDRLQQAFLQLQRFTADAAHELRTPLASLRVVGEVALEKNHDTQEYKETLGSILEETSRLNETINSLLLLARAEATQPGDQQSIFIASALVDEALGVLEVLLEERNISVAQENKTLGEVSICADRSLLRIAILNVLHNALKFSPTSSTIKISYSQPDNPTPSIAIAFEDQGPGIAAGEHQQVFERFFTSAVDASSGNSGSGLGLSITKLIVERSGGTIRFDEHYKQGAKCIIELSMSNQAAS
jgi:heavy metal sensor kinase